MSIIKTIMATASFRGCSFYIRNQSTRGMNRKYAIHEYPTTYAYIEDLGPQTLEMEFEGFVSIDSYTYVSRDLLEAALRVEGLGELIVPNRGMFKAACISAEIGEDINEKGLVLIRLAFVCATKKPQVPLTPLGIIDTQSDLLENALGGLDGLAGDGIIGSIVDGVVNGAVSAVTSVGISGIDSLFSNSTTGRYSQNYTDQTEAIINGTTGNNDRQKLASASQIAIQNTTNSKQQLSYSLSSISGGN